ncbi:G2/M phase-specific E3 ubiquitin-protein ligase-like [Ochlerotatus camptorhynchus]|uniref:G2/M phase-specific E3 ubiquitin-protein ligase-like n=1 Tax=Ochlerotatus camptorhynchus TaxID=644619 RepID=UPI0031D4CF16
MPKSIESIDVLKMLYVTRLSMIAVRWCDALFWTGLLDVAKLVIMPATCTLLPEDEEGIFGFMEEDIRNEEARIRGQKCYICKERYANVWCCAKKCFRSFHTLCGMQNECLSHYVETFQSWCDKHVALVDKVKHSETEACGICYDDMGPYRKLESIRDPCCQNGWFHRSYVAQFAQSARYFFNCPLCNKDDFSLQIHQRGIYIPEN